MIEQLEEWLFEKSFAYEEDNTEVVTKLSILFEDIELVILKIKDRIEEICFYREDLFQSSEELKDEEKLKIELMKVKEKILRQTTAKNETEDIESKKSQIYTEKEFIVREIPAPMGFLTMMEQLDRGTLVIPKNQRNYVWTKNQVENLAVSMIRGYPIPPLYGYRNEHNQIVVLDGQQRLISLYLYYKGVYLKSTSKMPINLKGILTANSETRKTNFLDELKEKFGIREQDYFYRIIDSETKNEIATEITYNCLDTNVKRFIDFKSINMIEIMVQGENINKEEIYFEIFGNLNQGGTPLKNQELRNGIYSCPFYDMLHYINDTNKKWREIYGVKHKHSRDVELLLRFVATQHLFNLKDGVLNLDGSSTRFEGSYPTLLNDFSKISLKFKAEEIKKHKESIEKFIDRLEGKESSNNLLLESLYWASSNIPGDYKIEKEFMDEIENSKDYKTVVKASSSSRTNVKKRLEYVYEKLKERYGG
ncbi:MAG: GmrSD restriction endonuclease domain-containing protein [Fusobacteriaceae bacterium]